jgi:transducin (beta)-like 1
MEGQLERSPYALKHIPRGELVELLSKALLYLEVESHWKGDTLASNCKSRFSLLEPHVCSLEPPCEPPASIFAFPPSLQSSDKISRSSKANGSAPNESVAKRKASPTTASNEGPAEKRQKSEAETEPPKDCKFLFRYQFQPLISTLRRTASKTKPPAPTSEPNKMVNGLPESISKKPAKPRLRQQGPGDDTTNPKSVLLLTGHKTEVGLAT